MSKLETTYDAFLDGKFHVKQPLKGHRSGTDALLLAQFSRAIENSLCVDIGSGVGVAGFALLTKRPLKQLALIEIQSEIAELAQENIALNHFKNVTVLNQDIKNRATLPANIFEFAICNPPFNPLSLDKSPLKEKALAHSSDNIEIWIKAAAHLLKAKGELALIDRPERLCDILNALNKAFGAIEIQPVFTNKEKPATRILIRAIMGNKTPLKILPSLELFS